MKRNPSLITIEDHREMGVEIKRVRRVSLDLLHCLRRSTSRLIPYGVYRIDDNFSVLKSLLENTMLRHCSRSFKPGFDWAKIYYGGTPEQPRILGDTYPRKLAIEHHQILNGALTDIQDTIDAIALRITPAYGATSQVGKAANRLRGNLEKLRTALRNEATRTYGDVGTAIYAR